MTTGRSLHRIGAVAGLVAGLVAGTVALFVAEPVIERAIAAESRNEHAGPAAGGDHAVVVRRGGQRLGLVVATSIYGFAIGGFVALAYGRADRRRNGFERPAYAALGFAGLAFLAVSLLPSLKYPPTPPGVGDPDAVNVRTLLYLAAVAIPLAALLAASRLGHVARRATPRGWARLAGAIAFLGLVGVGYWVLPSSGPAIGEPGQAQFQLVAVTTQAVLWGAFGLMFAFAVARAPGERFRWRTGQRRPEAA
jgi:hypothetical protein